MGKKNKIVEEDPILQKNFRLERRKQLLAQERERIAQQNAKEKAKLEQLNAIKQQVIEEQASIALASIAKANDIKPIKDIFLTSLGIAESESKASVVPNLQPINKNLPRHQIFQKEDSSIDDSYKLHFGVQLEASVFQRVQKQKLVDTGELVKKEMRQLFGKEFKEIDSKIKAQDEDDQVQYRIKPECKSASSIVIQEQQFQASNLFLKLIPEIQKKSTLRSTILESYADYIHIQNKEETSINQFRKDFVQHSLKHLELCKVDEKGLGFTNAKILILTPFMGDARAIIQAYTKELEVDEADQENIERLDEIEDDSDMFKVSIKISQVPSKQNKQIKQTKLRFFNSFNKSQIIIASPLGLRTITGAEGEVERDYSFLSSVQILLIDRAHVIQMQNWSHLVEVIKVVNSMPEHQSVVNPIQKIRQNFLNQKCRLYRQNIVFSEYSFPELNSLGRNHFQNHHGWVSETHFYFPLQPRASFHQEFLKVEVLSIDREMDVRLDFFKRKVWNNLLSNELLQKVVIFTSSYFQFVKLKAFMEKVNAPAEFISEHTKKPRVQSRVAQFNAKKVRFLVITERAYYFEVCQISKHHHLVFYSLPRNNWIYSRLAESFINPKTDEPGASNLNTLTAMWSKYQSLALQRIIGTTQAQDILSPHNKSSSLII